MADELSYSEGIYLTINDQIETSSGRLLEYRPLFGRQLNLDVGDDLRGLDLRMDTLKEGDGRVEHDNINVTGNAVELDHRVQGNIRHVDNDADNAKPSEIGYNNIGSSSQSSPIAIPDLPPGKLYHVFFSHSNEDREWVLQVVLRLESPEYGLNCCFADRDFDLGVPVFQNITKCIHASRRTVIVMSPEFVESPWCSYETRIIMEMNLDARQRLLIPVMLRQCRVPDFIGRLTYMNVNNEHFWMKFFDALRDQGLHCAKDIKYLKRNITVS